MASPPAPDITPDMPLPIPPSSSISPPPTPPSSSTTTTNVTALAPTSTNETVLSPPTNNTVQASSPSGGLPPGALAAMVVGIVIGAGIVLVGVGVFVFFYRRRKRKFESQNLPSFALKHDQPPAFNGSMLPMPARPPHLSPPAKPPSASGSVGSDNHFPPPSPGIPSGGSPGTFTYEELQVATDYFAEANLLGQGGFGYVHKGVLSDGRVVAVKQLKAGSGQGEREFQAEVDVINKVHHRHLVSLYGYCMSGAQRLLVYEFVPNKTLEFHLHGKGRPIMTWPTRMKIALGSAKGLAYLHEDCQPKIIHRDIKAANILIDDNFEAKVADFGLAKFSLDTDTHVSTRVMGTFGYLAPEYASSGKLTEKSDTFSYGVLLLELITGRRPFDKNDSSLEDGVVDWAMPLLIQSLEDHNFSTVADPRLQEYDSTEMTRMVACAAACVRHSARRRPRMSQVLRALEGNIPLEDLNDGVAPGHSRAFSHGSSEYSLGQYKDDMKKFKKLALESLELGSSGISIVTSDGARNLSSSSTTDGQQTTREIEIQEEEEPGEDTKVSDQSSTPSVTLP